MCVRVRVLGGEGGGLKEGSYSEMDENLSSSYWEGGKKKRNG